MAAKRPTKTSSPDEDQNIKVTEALERLRTTLSDAEGFTSCHSFLRNSYGRSAVDRWRRVRFTPELTERYRSSLVREILHALPAPELLIPFSYEAPTVDQVPVFSKEEFPTLADWLDEVPTPDWNMTFDGDETFLSGVKVHVAVLSGEELGSGLRIFRRRTASSLIKRQGILGSFSGPKNQFDAVKTKIFDFPTDAEFFEWEGHVYILDINALEALTDIREITNTQAKKAIASIRAIKNLTVDGIDAVERSLAERPRLAKRLAAAAKHNTFDSIKLNTLTGHIAEYGLPLKATNKAGKVTISFDVENRVHIEEFVNLVADVYLRSSSTGLDYKAHSKELYKKK